MNPLDFEGLLEKYVYAVMLAVKGLPSFDVATERAAVLGAYRALWNKLQSANQDLRQLDMEEEYNITEENILEEKLCMVE